MANPQEIEAFQNLMQRRQSINEMVMGAKDLNEVKTELLFEENKQFMLMQQFCILQQRNYDPSGGRFNLRRFFINGAIGVLSVAFTIALSLGIFYVFTHIPPETYQQILKVIRAKLPGGMGGGE